MLKLNARNQRDRDDAMYAWLSNRQLMTVLEGGRTAIVAVSPTRKRYGALIDLNGLVIEGSYVADTRGWSLDF